MIARLWTMTELSIACVFVHLCVAVGAEEDTFSVSLGKGVKMAFVLVRPGSFMMGLDKGRTDEGPAHNVTIGKAFYMSRYEVTQRQYEAVMGTNPSGFKGARKPVENISWLMAVAFCERFSEKTGKETSNGRQEGQEGQGESTEAKGREAGESREEEAGQTADPHLLNRMRTRRRGSTRFSLGDTDRHRRTRTNTEHRTLGLWVRPTLGRRGRCSSWVAFCSRLGSCRLS